MSCDPVCVVDVLEADEPAFVEVVVEAVPAFAEILVPGEPGASAYAVWLAAGNIGSVEDFLASLVSTAPGPPGASAYDHQQPAPSDIWTIAHNRGVRPAVATFSVGGVEIQGAVQHLSDDVVLVRFVIPIAGYARLT